MTEYTANGLSLRWDEPDLVATAQQRRVSQVLVGVRPAHPSNAVKAIYSVNGGAARIARGYRVRAAGSGEEELFAVDLPSQPTDAVLAFIPILSCSGREADPRRGGCPFTPLVQQPLAHVAEPTAEARGSPQEPFSYTMELLARITAPLDKAPEVVGETPEGLRIVFPLGEGGTVRGPRLNGLIRHAGGDWMLVRPDGVGLSEVRVLIRADNGAIVMGEYGGVVDFGADGYEALAKGRGPARAAVQLAPHYLTAAASLSWLNRLQCIGLGRVTMATLLVEYDLYAMRSRALENP
jgi:hypothetical protein